MISKRFSQAAGVIEDNVRNFSIQTWSIWKVISWKMLWLCHLVWRRGSSVVYGSVHWVKGFWLGEALLMHRALPGVAWLCRAGCQVKANAEGCRLVYDAGVSVSAHLLGEARPLFCFRIWLTAGVSVVQLNCARVSASKHLQLFSTVLFWKLYRNPAFFFWVAFF